jgi:hypothetical protein
MLELHPSELKNIALAAAAVAEREGFTGTAEAWAQIARVCALEAIALVGQASANLPPRMSNYMMETVAA